MDKLRWAGLWLVLFTMGLLGSNALGVTDLTVAGPLQAGFVDSIIQFDVTTSCDGDGDFLSKFWPPVGSEGSQITLRASDIAHFTCSWTG